MENAKRLQNILENEGFKTLAAGGFVRDYILGVEPNDIDLATEARPKQVIEILERNNIKTFETGLKHGTVTAVVDDKNYEITTLRVDKNCDGRHADVEFTNSFEEDAKRRDFTMNALFMDLNTMKIIDYVDGVKSAERRNLNFVGDPDERIKEDYLRVVRLFRFSATIPNCTLNPKSRFQARKYLKYLPYVSSERIREEVLKMLIGDSINLAMLQWKFAIEALFPELGPLFTKDNKNIYMNTCMGLDNLRGYKDKILSFTCLFRDVALPLKDQISDYELESEKIASRVCDRLMFSSKDKNRVKFLIRNSGRIHDNVDENELRQLISDCDEFGDANLVYDLFKLYGTKFIACIFDIYDEVECKINDEMEKFKQAKFCSPLHGIEIMKKLGIKQGKEVGIIKNELKKMVVEGRLRQDKDEAYEAMEEIWKKLQDKCS